jgi:hypothetical protein
MWAAAVLPSMLFIVVFFCLLVVCIIAVCWFAIGKHLKNRGNRSGSPIFRVLSGMGYFGSIHKYLDVKCLNIPTEGA